MAAGRAAARGHDGGRAAQHNAQGLFATLAGEPQSLAGLNLQLQGQRLRRCDPDCNGTVVGKVSRGGAARFVGDPPPNLAREHDRLYAAAFKR